MTKGLYVFENTDYAKLKWPIYDTKKTFDILEAQRKISWDELREDRTRYRKTLYEVR